MAYVSTDSASLGGTAGGAGLVQKAYDRLLEFALRSEPLIRSVADKRPARQAIPGSTVVLQRYVDLSVATTALTETTDPDAVAMSTPTSVTITLNEYGNSVLVTRALELFSLADVDPAIANIIAFNLADSIDSVAMTTLRGGSNVIYSGSTATSTATSPLTETDDVDSVALSTPTSVTITLSEYGNSVLVTRALEIFSLADVDPAIANIIAFNLADSIDSIAMTTLRGGSNVIYSGSTATSTATITAAATLSSANVLRAVAKLRANKAVPRKGTNFWAGIHPEVSHDFRLATDTGNWLVPNQYGASQDRVWAGEIGVYGGAYFVETPRMYKAADGSGGTAANSVYRTIICGQQALAEAVAEEPHTVIGPVVDRLMRHRPMGWYGVLGFARYREEALFRIESGSSIAS
jgi:hypothetical protein